MAEKDYYDILGVNENASESDIKRAYRNLAKKYHPDINRGDSTAEARFKDISEAYSVLSNSEKRQKYDQMRKYGAFDQSGGFNFNGFDFRDFQGGGTRFESSGSGSIFDEMFGGGGFGNIFDSMFNRGEPHRQSRRSPRKGSDLEVEIEIPFDLAISGGNYNFKIRKAERCLACAGTSRKPGTNQVICTECRGTGQIEKQKSYTIKIPQGIESGTRLRLKGQGNSGRGNAAAGDLLVNVRVGAHHYFRREGADIHTNVKINMVQAALGSTVKIKTVTGKTVELKIPAGTQSGRVFRLRGMGINSGTQKGDHLVHVQVETPMNLTEKQMKILKDFAREVKLDF